MSKIIVAALVFIAACAAVRGAERPNIVLIFSDDQGYGDVSCYGGDLPTPHIDSLARDGARFTDFYVASPVCTPSRFSLLTGRLPNRSKDQLLGPLMFAEDVDLSRGIREGETTIASLLKKQGYRTALIGKWHLGHGDVKFLPTHHGFDSFYGHTGGCIDYWTLDYGNRPSWYRNEALLSESGYATDLLTDAAVKLIRDQPVDQPYFLYLPYNAPHFAKAWDATKNDFAHELQAKPQDIAAFAHVPDEKRRLYCAMVKAMDDGIGRVLEAIRQREMDRNTIVLFICDNGADPNYGGSNAPLRGAKHTLYEGGIRVPALVRWTGRIKAGQVIDQPASTLDLVPTFCKIIGIDTSGLPLDGVDLGPVLFEGKRIKRDLYFNRGFDAALRRGDWKFIRTPESEPTLYNLALDPNEKYDLASRNPKKLRELMDAHAAISATLPTPEITPFVRKTK